MADDKASPQNQRKKDIQPNLERFILISHDVAMLFCLTMNCELIVELNETTKYVRKAWIVNNDREVDKVYSISKGMSQKLDELLM